MNVGEEIVAEYLTYIKGCDFVQKNTRFPDKQGEIDVFGIRLEDKTIYTCEVATHIRGLQYMKDKKINNKNKIFEKFRRDIEYANRHFDGYRKIYMFWSPIVKDNKNQLDQLNKAMEKIRSKYDVDVELIINERFLNCINELREFAAKQTQNIDAPILRFLQIEEFLRRERYRSKRRKK